MEHKPDISELLVVLVSFSLYVSQLSFLFTDPQGCLGKEEQNPSLWELGAWEVIFGSKGKRKRAGRRVAAALAQAEAVTSPSCQQSPP